MCVCFTDNFLSPRCFLRISKVWSMLYTGQQSEFRVKNATLCLHVLFRHFFVAFYQKICVFIIFISFFDKVSNFRNRILIQSEAGTSGKKLSVELYDGAEDSTRLLTNNSKSSRPDMFQKNAVLKNFIKFTGKIPTMGSCLW